VIACTALFGIALAAAPASAETLKAEDLLEIYHSHGLPPTVAPPVKKILSQVVSALEKGETDQALDVWKSLWQRYPTEFSPAERTRMQRWVLYRAYLTKGKPLGSVIASWEQEHKTPSAQKLALSDLESAMGEQGQVVHTVSSIMKNMHDTMKATIQNAR
jgi:hypothetical protein